MLRLGTVAYLIFYLVGAVFGEVNPPSVQVGRGPPGLKVKLDQILAPRDQHLRMNVNAIPIPLRCLMSGLRNNQ